jgi:hypothetical protein
VEDTYHLRDDKLDILSHAWRRDQIHVLTIDPILGVDVCERLRGDDRLKRYKVIRPRAQSVGDAMEELEEMAKGTVGSRLLIFDVRRVTLPKLRRPFNAIVGYNRRDFNKLCYSICIGDGPPTVFQNGYSLTAFIPYLSGHRVDHYPAVFFYDPFLHYEPHELETRGIDEEFVIPDEVPRRLAGYLQNMDHPKLDRVRRFFRATGKDGEVRKRRRRMLKRLYKRQLSAQFPDRPEEIKGLLSRRGLRLATEKMNLYPLFFEDWVCRLVHKAEENAFTGTSDPGQ